MPFEVTIRLPRWVDGFLRDRAGRACPDDEARMRLVVDLARENVRRGSGGPFAAAVFDAAGRLIAPGVNIVTTANCSACHAEIVALMLAQQALGRYDLGNGGAELLDLATAAEPCAMCLGAIPWAGVARVVCGARDEDVRSFGFDEGAKPSDWSAALRDRGIAVVRDVLRRDAADVISEYVRSGGVIYGPR
jgi:tRNA(Arg) A34 adenosine deaminase TadA